MKIEGMFKELVETSDNIVIVTDPGFNIRYVSSAVEKSFDIEPQRLLGRNVFEFVNPERVEAWKACLRDQNNSINDEISLTAPSGKKAYFDVQVTNLINGLALQLHDVTERKNAEHALKISNQQMDQVIYKTTHDLKAPLASAMALINLAQQATDDEMPRFLEMIRKSLLKLDTFIDEMNNFFRNEKLAVKREKVDLKSIVQEEIQDLYSLAETKHIHFELTFEGEEIDFYSDSIRVRTIITNLLSNAFKYSDAKKKEPFIRICISLNQEFCQIRIIDNGIGIDQKLQNKIFDLFFRATDQNQGTGIGLFIVKDTIQKLKGTIEVSSTLCEGTTFQIQIPNQIYQPLMAD